jgi:hypothetical protein
MIRRGSAGLALAILLLVHVAAAQETTGAPMDSQDDARPQSAPRGNGGSATDDDNRALAETLFFAGRGLMDAGRTASACPKFAESYRLDPAPGTLLNLAVCHEKMGRIAAAWGEYREAIADARKAGRPDREKLASDRLAAIEPDLPFLTIVVPPGTKVPGLEVKRNGVSLKEATWGLELPVDPGNVEVTASAPGMIASRLSIAIATREHESLTLEPLHPAPHTGPVKWSGGKVAGLWTMIGGGALLAGGGVLGYLALNAKNSSNDQCKPYYGVQACTPGGAAAMSDAHTFAWGADAALGAGVLALGIGSYLFFTSGSNVEPGPAPTPPPVALDLRMSPGLAFAGLKGDF